MNIQTQCKQPKLQNDILLLNYDRTIPLPGSVRVSELADKLSSPDEDIELPTCGGQLGLLHHQVRHLPPGLLVAPHRLGLDLLDVAAMRGKMRRGLTATNLISPVVTVLPHSRVDLVQDGLDQLDLLVLFPDGVQIVLPVSLEL